MKHFELRLHTSDFRLSFSEVPAVLHFLGYWPEAGHKPGSSKAEAAAGRGADEGARAVERQCRDVLAERRPLAILIQVLFDVRKIKRADSRAVGAQVSADGANRFWTAEVSDNRDHEIVRLQLLEEGKAIFRRQVASRHSGAVVFRHQ